LRNTLTLGTLVPATGTDARLGASQVDARHAGEEESMRRLLIVAIVALVTVTASAADIAGTWVGSIETQMGEMMMTITIEQGEPFAGTVKTNMFEARIEKAARNGDAIHFEVTSEMGSLVFDGTVAGDEMNLAVASSNGNDYQMKCRRQKK